MAAARQQLVILGTGILAEEVAELAEQSGEWELAGFVENRERERCERPLLGRPVTWLDDAGPLSENHLAVCAIGTTPRRGFIERAAALGFGFGTVRHPSAVVSPSAKLGAGTVAGAGIVVAAHARVGDHVILNRGVLVGHHTRVGSFVTISPGANVGGSATIGDGCCIEMGSVILDRLTVGAGSVVAPGAVVTRDVPESVQVAGVPARVVKDALKGS